IFKPTLLTTNMGRSLNMTNSRRPHHKFAGADHDTATATAQAQPQSRDKPMENIQIKGRGRNNHQGPQDGRRHGRGRDKTDRRSMSPSRGTSPGTSGYRHREEVKNPNRRSRNPLADRITRDNAERQQQARASKAPTPAAQASAKRKRIDGEGDGKPHSDKKARSGPGQMQSAQKCVTGLAAISKLSEEERKRLRAEKFKTKSMEPKPRPQQEKGQREATLIAMTKSPVTGATTTNNNVAPNTNPNMIIPTTQNENEHHYTVVTIQSRDKLITKVGTTAVDAPEPSKEKQPVSNTQDTNGQKHTKKTQTSLSPSSTKAGTPPVKPKQEAPGQDHGRQVKKTKSGSGSQNPPERPLSSVAIARMRSDQIMGFINEKSAYEEGYPDHELTFIDYGVYSIPVMCSKSIEHQIPFQPVYTPSVELKAILSEDAVDVFNRKMILLRQDAIHLAGQNILKSEDLGRKNVRKTEPIRFIDDCDLYLYEGKIHVATERGLLLAADYLKLIGVPDTQPVRFNGYAPSWMKAVKAKREQRRVSKVYEVDEEAKKEGYIDLYGGYGVAVYEVGIFDKCGGKYFSMAYGERCQDGVRGWFPYSHTCRTDWLKDPLPGDKSKSKRDPDLIDWAKFDYGPLIARAEQKQAAAQAAAVKQRQEAAAAVALKQQAAAAARKELEEAATAAALKQQAAAAAKIANAPSMHNASSPKASASLALVSLTSTNDPTEKAAVEASSASGESQQETVQMLSISVGPISPRDIPQTPSNKAASETNRGEVDGLDAAQNHTIATVTETITEIAPVAVEEARINPFTKPRMQLPGFSRDDIEYDWGTDDDDDL
ncbi:hypothetical protein BDW02DRAFT_497510, partial [Decorospora gaudefroyi]